MRRLFSRGMKRGIVGLALLLFVAAAVTIWVERSRLQAWYCVHRLTAANEGDREAWVDRVAGLDQAALPALLDCLTQEDARICGNAQAALARLAVHGVADAERAAALAQRLAEAFPRLSSTGKQSVLALEAVWRQPFQAKGSQRLAAIQPAVAHLLEEASHVADNNVRSAALSLAAFLAERVQAGEVTTACRALTAAYLRDGELETRTRAIGLALQPNINLPRELVPLLDDSAAAVRRAAMLALGPREAISTDDLLHWLHDPDEDVCRLCEGALRGRGLREEHLKLGRIITDGKPANRLRILDCLGQVTDLEPGVWLRRLSHDPAPAVRAAAVRASSEHSLIDLTDRLEQMAQNDPCPTVRQLAQHYLSCRTQRRTED